jgi:hypothetical protein
MLGILFYPEDGRSRFLQNVDDLPDYMASHAKNNNTFYLTCAEKSLTSLFPICFESKRMPFIIQQDATNIHKQHLLTETHKNDTGKTVR